MGEQSVGKSFTLNHLVDTSFAGSAMRTTGQFLKRSWFKTITDLAQRVFGCLFLPPMMHSSLRWTSKVGDVPRVTRTWALTDFPQMPGVHSLERSAQEDTLLVLFNTAISNLVSD
jgi:hypothetical protein